MKLAAIFVFATLQILSVTASAQMSGDAVKIGVLRRLRGGRESRADEKSTVGRDERVRLQRLQIGEEPRVEIGTQHAIELNGLRRWREKWDRADEAVANPDVLRCDHCPRRQ